MVIWFGIDDENGDEGDYADRIIEVMTITIKIMFIAETCIFNTEHKRTHNTLVKCHSLFTKQCV